MSETIESILVFWFGNSSNTLEICSEKEPMWWSKNPEIDREITGRFETVTLAIAAGRLGEWQASPPGLLASIIALDQFPRNMYRGTAKSFAFDSMALGFANTMIGNGWDKELHRAYRGFSYMPFEHSEDIRDQRQCVSLFRQLHGLAPEEEKDKFGAWVQFAIRHMEIIERFGRFPHRNPILERPSTGEEDEFLRQPNSSF
ncbi:MAG: DUF924 domain-containing protein [Gammaproteobacteria bacterium]|nr:DUF924 domain-containing protein [Gammaproteobacteria bacterium]